MVVIAFVFVACVLIICSDVAMVEAKSILSMSWLQRSGQFSWFYPKFDINNDIQAIPTQEITDTDQDDPETTDSFNFEEFTKNMKSFQIHEETFPTAFQHQQIKYCIQKAFSSTSFHYWKGQKYRILLTNDGKVMISHKAWPLGWHHYLFKLHIQEKQDQEGYYIDIYTINTSRSMKEFLLRIDLSSSSLSGNVFHHPKASKALIQSLFDPTIYHLKKVILEYGRIFERRKEQQEEYSKASESAEEERKRKERDRIIHPEKYKAKSPTVKGVGASRAGGSGRYSPSADARARRAVKRGG